MTFKKLIESPCYYYGIENSRHLNTKVHNYKYNGIDRIDNKQRYYYTNCISCCKLCNKAKSDLPVEIFIEWLDRIAKYRNK